MSRTMLRKSAQFYKIALLRYLGPLPRALLSQRPAGDDAFYHAPSRATETDKLVLTLAGGIAFGYAISLAMMFIAHTWILDGLGHPIKDDFVVFWAAGHAALKGAALLAYDTHRQHAAEVATIGHGFSGTLGWSYPPLFLFVAAALASLPYVYAFVLWLSSTVALHASVMAAIAKRRIAFVVACAAPWVLTALTPGQNGFLTSAIIGLVLLHLEKRPALAGLILGLLSYKPQFGILFPLALAAGGYWRAFAWACVSTLAWNGLACAVFGFETFSAFFHALSATTETHLTHMSIGWNTLQSLYGLVRALGGSLGAAEAAQAFLAALAAITVVLCWRGQAPFSLKAAVLAAAIPLVTPYIFVYDLPMLAVAVAFLFRHRSFDKMELVLLAATAPCVYAVILLPMPSAFFASLAVAGIAARRIYCAGALTRITPSCTTGVPSSA
ncbi:MAG: glycosyltransferase family 87 protein [Rhizomicrobium sp.]